LRGLIGAFHNEHGGPLKQVERTVEARCIIQ